MMTTIWKIVKTQKHARGHSLRPPAFTSADFQLMEELFHKNVFFFYYFFLVFLRQLPHFCKIFNDFWQYYVINKRPLYGVMPSSGHYSPGVGSQIAPPGSMPIQKAYLVLRQPGRSRSSADIIPNTS
jgi:hypothetical protein